MFNPPTLYYSDGYKPGHKAMLAKDTLRMYGTWVPRHLKRAPKGVTKVLSIGQQLTARWIHDEFEERFFKMPADVAVKFGEDMSLYLGLPYDASHFEALHALGYLPLRIKALPEGVETPANVPHMTFFSTMDGFAWLTLYVETVLSSLSWKTPTSGSIGLQYKRNLTEWVMRTDPDNAFLIPYLAHDFSARGLDPFSMLASGIGHAASFRGSDSLIVIPGARYFYGEPEGEVCINSVNASEHSVSTTKIFTVGEERMMVDWLTDFPKGIFSMVADTFDLTAVVKPAQGGFLFNQKELIMKRDGKLVIRPDSGDPVEIICGHGRTHVTDEERRSSYPEFYRKGLIECLWEIFGGTINAQGYKVLDPHIGAIYGDSITLERQVEIYARLAAKGFAATNIVLGVGSFTYQYNTRDTFGWAAKGAWFEVLDASGNRVGYAIYKDPTTDDGSKRSLRGLVCVTEDFRVLENCTWEQEGQGILRTIYENGRFGNLTTLTEIRSRVDELASIQSTQGVGARTVS